MTDREKLGKLIMESWCFSAEEIVAHLTANGVVVREKGEWLKVKEPLGWHEADCIECSNCHESWIIDEEYGFEYLCLWSFCPNCGADMRKEG